VITLEELTRAVREMRVYQKRVSKSAIGSYQYRDALHESKVWEKVVDDMIKPAEEKQINLFQEEAER
jgi:hypothetical protein